LHVLSQRIHPGAPHVGNGDHIQQRGTGLDILEAGSNSHECALRFAMDDYERKEPLQDEMCNTGPTSSHAGGCQKYRTNPGCQQRTSTFPPYVNTVSCHVPWHSLSVCITTFNTAAKQIFRMDSPCGIPLSLVLQESSARFVNSMTRALKENASSQRPVGGISFASANLHALRFRSVCGLFTASATLVYLLDHTTAEGVLFLGADIPKAWQQTSTSKEVECNNYVVSARMQTRKESFSSDQEDWERSTAPIVTWSSCLVETIYFQG